MTDAVLRELERDSAASGCPVTAARLLVARLRLGELFEDHLALAAHLGHEPAGLALGLPLVPSAWTESYLTCQDLSSAVEVGLLPFGRELLVRTGVAAAEICRSVEPAPRCLFHEAALGWLLCPCDPHVLTAARISYGPAVGGISRPALAAKFACSAVVEAPPSAARCAAVAVELTVAFVAHMTQGTVTTVRDSIRSTLVGWSVRGER